ncbi:MAG TPA: diacylglycerol kinase family protein [Gaiellaceae bacterium]
MNERRTVFLVNPASDNGATGRRWPEIANRAAAAGLTGDALVSERPGQLTELAREAAEGGAELLVAVGGDGTVNEVVNGIAGRAGVELAIVPRGTGRDFVRTYVISHRVDDAIRTAVEGRTREIDLGRARFRSWQGKTTEAYFANIASAGMSGAIAKRANETSKALGGRASYLWATFAVFAGWRTSEISVEADGEVRRSPMHLVVVANGRYFGGGMMITPDADPDDGVFDVLVIGNLTKRDLLLTLPKTYFGRHLPHPKAELLRATTVEIETKEPMPVELDGEQPGTTPVRFEVVPRALRLRVPR